MEAKEEYRYNRLTWEEMNEAIALQKVVLLPTGSTEQHGKHLPLDVDLLLSESICLEVGRRAADRVLVLPPIAYGLNLHHIDFPGTVHIEPDVYIAFCLNITKSVAYHGFEKIVLVNGHGSNGSPNDLVARKTVLETNSLCFSTHLANFLLDAFAPIKESEVMAHADEFETSLYLHLAPERVQMAKAARADDRMGQFVSSDSPAYSNNNPVRFNDYWGRWTELGVHGDPTKATAEKGAILFEAAVEGMIGAVDEIKAWPIEQRSDQHSGPVQSQIRW
jgi:creatinine amidohydrolase